jgi:catechol 2,3-dioxygenase-like lactoylglutathione lyase family enzyme
MISGSHVMIFSADAEADRIFLRDMLDLPCIDNGGGWLIFKLPPAELGVHGGTNGFHQLYLICDDLDATIAQLRSKGVGPDEVATQDWGRSTGVTLPGGGTLGIYEAHHARP